MVKLKSDNISFTITSVSNLVPLDKNKS